MLIGEIVFFGTLCVQRTRALNLTRQFLHLLLKFFIKPRLPPRGENTLSIWCCTKNYLRFMGGRIQAHTAPFIIDLEYYLYVNNKGLV